MTGQVTIEGENSSSVFDVEIAADDQNRAIGLMYRRFLDVRHGMLFDFKRTQDVNMWMKNTYIPLDMIFITALGVVRRIEEYAVPFSEEPVSSGGPIRYVLEVRAGTSRRLGLALGQKVSFSWMSQ
ncbi:MAG: DUF192 domain-containing protein [Alphaproteobacteria bacterium]|nr:DUF192 domain-containing protein [Alphaproteobacteria bacterium]